VAHEAASKLYDLGAAAFPEILKHLSDNRQSIPLAPVIPCSLGKACYFLIANQVNPNIIQHDEYLLLDGSSNLIEFWWSERQGRDLMDLRIEAQLFALTLAEVDHNQARVKTIQDWLQKNEVHAVEDQLAPMRELAYLLAFNGQDQELVNALGAPETGSFLARRFASERSMRSFMKLLHRGKEAIPTLISTLRHEQLGDRCLWVLQTIVEDQYIPRKYPRFALLTKVNATDWWATRSGKDIHELRLEAAKYHLDAASKGTFSSSKKRESVVEFLKERVRTMESGGD
jgi:hypothetical protein